MLDARETKCSDKPKMDDEHAVVGSEVTASDFGADFAGDLDGCDEI